MKKRFFLDTRLIDQTENVERVLAPSRLHPEFCTLNGKVGWKENNLHVTWMYDPATGTYRGWRNDRLGTADTSGDVSPMHVMPVHSEDGIHWQDDGPASYAESIVEDPTDPDPARRYKCIYHGIAELDSDGRVVACQDDMDALLAARVAGRNVRSGMFSACSADGLSWHDHRPVVLDRRPWEPGVNLAHNTDHDKAEADDWWWRPGDPDWTGGDSYPCLLHLPEEGKFVAFFRTNIDRRTSLKTKKQRRERAVGRVECTTFGEWSPHEVVLRSNVDWQAACGHGKHDFYQLQVWPLGDIYLGLVSAFYWSEDYNHLELAWSPDTVHWERICPQQDVVPRAAPQTFGGCNYYACMRPREINGEVRVYMGVDEGRHNADPQSISTLMLAYFQPDRFAGIADKGGATGSIRTTPLQLSGGTLHLNLAADGGQVRAELQDESGRAVPGFSFDDCETISGDHADACVRWRGQVSLPEGRCQLALKLSKATLYSVWTA